MLHTNGAVLRSPRFMPFALLQFLQVDKQLPTHSDVALYFNCKGCATLARGTFSLADQTIPVCLI